MFEMLEAQQADTTLKIYQTKEGIIYAPSSTTLMTTTQWESNINEDHNYEILLVRE